MTGKPILILVVSLFAFCLGNPDCSPTARCSDLWIAKECNVVKECIKEWSSLKLPELEDDVCSICLEMVKEARDTLRSNTTREELKEVFEGSCKLLTLKPAVEACDRLVDQFVPELVDILSSQMDPQVVCSVAKLCNNAALRVSQKESIECTECQSFMHTSDMYMRKRVSLESFKNGMLEVCRTAGSFSDICSHLGVKHANFLYDLVKSVLHNEPCEATLVCPVMPKTASFPSTPTEIRSDALCSSCNDVMSNLRRHLLRAKTPERFAENVLKICKKLDLSNGACSKLASPEFYEKLKSSETLPKLFCQATFCREKSNEVPIWPLVSISDQRVDTDFFDFLTFSDSLLREEKQREAMPTPRPTISYGDAIVNPMFFGPLLSSKLYTVDKEECETCNEVLQVLSEPVRNDDDYLSKMFDVVCIGVKKQEECQRFIAKYSPFLTRAFAEGGVSKELCVDLVPSCQVKRSELTPPQSCNLCLNVMKVLKRGNSTHLGPFLEEQCNTAVAVPQYICRDLTSTFENLASLLQTSTERDACSFVKLCESTPVEIQPVSKPTCESCMLTIQSLADILKSNYSDDVIKTTLNSLCDLLPYVERKLCLNLIKMVGVDGFKKLVEHINPTEICTELHICKKKEESQMTTTTVVPVPKAVTGEPGSGSKVPCKFCIMAIKMLLDQLQDDKTEDAIRKALDNICQYFPEETRDTCRNLIDQYAEDIIDMIIADFNATEICTYLKICPARHLIGEDGHDQNRATFDVNTNEVRDWIEPQEENKTVIVSKQIEAAFHQFHKVVQECAMCEALVGVITNHRKMLVKDYDFSSNAYKICSIVPKDKVKMCTSMIVSYGPSIVNLILDHHIEPNEICVYIDLCSELMQAKVNQPVSVPEPKVIPEENKCMLGPVFWCANAENAEKCGTFLHCQETVWKSWKSPPTRRSDNL